MPLIQCPDCKAPVSSAAPSCPVCAKPLAGAGHKAARFHQVLACLCIVAGLWMFATAATQRHPSGALIGIASMLGVLGVVWFFATRTVAWWRHG